jgi:hypothetical protein
MYHAKRQSREIKSRWRAERARLPTHTAASCLQRVTTAAARIRAVSPPPNAAARCPTSLRGLVDSASVDFACFSLCSLIAQSRVKSPASSHRGPAGGFTGAMEATPKQLNPLENFQSRTWTPWAVLWRRPVANKHPHNGEANCHGQRSPPGSQPPNGLPSNCGHGLTRLGRGNVAGPYPPQRASRIPVGLPTVAVHLNFDWPACAGCGEIHFQRHARSDWSPRKSRAKKITMRRVTGP